jgi:hypothetical protein
MSGELATANRPFATARLAWPSRNPASQFGSLRSASISVLIADPSHFRSVLICVAPLVTTPPLMIYLKP